MDIVLISGNDWEGLYINGKCVFQNHIIYGYDVVDCLVGEIRIMTNNEKEKLEYEGVLPDTLDELNSWN